MSGVVERVVAAIKGKIQRRGCMARELVPRRRYGAAARFTREVERADREEPRELRALMRGRTQV